MTKLRITGPADASGSSAAPKAQPLTSPGQSESANDAVGKPTRKHLSALKVAKLKAWCLWQSTRLGCAQFRAQESHGLRFTQGGADLPWAGDWLRLRRENEGNSDEMREKYNISSTVFPRNNLAKGI